MTITTENTDRLDVFQLIYDTGGMADSALWEIAPVTLSPTTHTRTEKSPILEEFLQAYSSDLECQAANETVVLSASLFSDYCHVVLI